MNRLLVSFVLLLSAGCCSHDAAVKALDRGIAATDGHMADESLPQEAREIATDSHDVFHQVKFNLTGEKVPDDVQARADARKPSATDDAETEREDANGGGE